MTESRSHDSHSNEYSLPILYNLDKNGKYRLWKIRTEDNCVIKEYGEVGGKLIPSERSFEGKNIGKKNETSPTEQARRVAERDWISQLDKGYYPRTKAGKEMADRILREKKRCGNVNSQLDTLIRGEQNDNDSDINEKKESKTKKSTNKAGKLGKNTDDGTVPDYISDIMPMLCDKWSEIPKVLKYFDFEQGVYVQPKLDGIRCIAQQVGDGIAMTTRKGKQIKWLKHIREQLKDLLNGNEQIILDGEIYAKTIYATITVEKKTKVVRSSDTDIVSEKEKFNIISGAVRPTLNAPSDIEGQLSFYIFDVADENLTQKQRFGLLNKLLKNMDRYPNIKRVKTKIIHDPKEIYSLHDEYFQSGYEGVIIRSQDCDYLPNKRSGYIRKYKQFQDAEYKITGLSLDSGVDKEHFRWICVTENGDSFCVKPTGDRATKLLFYKTYKRYIGKMLTVKFQTLSGDGIPRFGVGMAIRDYE